MSEHPPVQDDITIHLQAQKIIVHETVRVNVAIQAQVDPSQSEADFRSEIYSTLRKFIDSDWKIQSIQRSKGTKYENVYVTATARVPEKENHQLTERANSLTRIGFELVNPNVDYSLTFDEIQKVNAELRLTLMKQALIEATKLNDAYKEMGHGRPRYRVSSTRFDNGNSQQVNNSPVRGQFNMAMTASPLGGTAAMPVNTMYEEPDGACADEEPADLNVSTRFSMTGAFILRSMFNA